MALLRPETLGLAPCSTWTFDAWTALRARSLNSKTAAHMGRQLFGEALLGDTGTAAAATLQAFGYETVDVTTLDALSQDYGVAKIADPRRESWLVITAQVAATVPSRSARTP